MKNDLTQKFLVCAHNIKSQPFIIYKKSKNGLDGQKC